MKKPNITGGDWKIKRNEDLNNKWHRIASIGNREIVSFHGHQYGTAIANAKAISAVLDMIDALIPVAEEVLSHVATEEYVNEDDLNPESHLGKITITVQDARNIFKALEKAGVNYE